jgi:hypothetical protein
MTSTLMTPETGKRSLVRCERRVDVVEFVAIGKALGIDPYRLLKKVLA